MEKSLVQADSQLPTKGKADLVNAASKIADIYMEEITSLNAAVGVPMTDEAKRCGVNAVLSLCGELGAAEVQKLPRAQLVQVIQFVTINGLDIFSGQVFIDKRWNKEAKSYSIKATPMGSAYEIMVKRFGVDVKTVHQPWVIHEGDDFSLPQFEGLKIVPPHFKPTLKGLSGKAIAVCYPIEKTHGDPEYIVSTREEVARNLVAQILQNTLSNQNVNRNDMMKKLEGRSLEDLLNDDSLATYISPAYKSPASREGMIIAKMKKNALLHYTRDLGSKAYASEADAIEHDSSSDMVNKDVVASVDEEGTNVEGTKIQDFDADENGEIKSEAVEPEKEGSSDKETTEPTNAPSEPAKDKKEAIKPEVVTPTKQEAKEDPHKNDSPTINFFNVEDLK